jgi:RecB family endonuclease NucS
MYNSPEGSYGRQYPIAGLGRIDLLAEDAKTGDLIVIELKRDESHEQVVGQISLYMSWVRENLAAKTRKVSGIICVNTASSKLLLAAGNIEGVEVYEYSLSFRKL